MKKIKLSVGDLTPGARVVLTDLADTLAAATKRAAKKSGVKVGEPTVEIHHGPLSISVVRGKKR